MGVRSGKGRWRGYLLVGLLCVALGVCAGSWLTVWWNQDSVSGAKAEGPSVLEVAPEPFLDERAMPVQLNGSRQWSAKSPLSGVLRSSSCQENGEVASGQSVFAVGDVPVLALYLERPAYRDLGPGSVGDDVAVLQKELARLGHFTGTVNGKYDAATAGAVKRLKKAAGLDAKDSGLSLSQLVWLPQPSVPVSQCQAAVGDIVEAGQEVFSTANLSGVLQITGYKSADGAERLAVLDQVTAPINQQGQITDGQFISKFTASSQFKTSADSGNPLTVRTRLAQPISSYRLPVTALYEVSGDTACVLDNGKAAQVQVVGSAFGSSVVISKEALHSVSVAPGKDAPKCR